MVRKTIKYITLFTVCSCLLFTLLYFIIYIGIKSDQVKFNPIHSSMSEIKCENNALIHLLNNNIIWKNSSNVLARCKNRIIIVSHYRTGSSFFGNLLQQSLSTYYIYEPLYYLGDTIYIDEIKNKNKINVALNTLVNLFNCKGLNGIRNNRKIYWALHWTKVMKEFKNEKGKLANTHQICDKCVNILIKSVRINIEFLAHLYNNFKSDHKPLKTVVLLRDPRAIINSRLNPSLGFCYGKCRDPGTVCQQIRANLQSLIDLKSNSSDILEHLTVIRYEDLALNTKSLAKQLYERLDLSYTKTVEEWIQKTTHEKRNNLKTPLRNTTENVITWLNTFKKWKMDLNYVQDQCSDVMQMLGYKPIDLQELNDNQDIKPSRLISNEFPLKIMLNKNFIKL